METSPQWLASLHRRIILTPIPRESNVFGTFVVLRDAVCSCSCQIYQYRWPVNAQTIWSCAKIPVPIQRPRIYSVNRIPILSPLFQEARIFMSSSVPKPTKKWLMVLKCSTLHLKVRLKQWWLLCDCCFLLAFYILDKLRYRWAGRSAVELNIQNERFTFGCSRCR